MTSEFSTGDDIFQCTQCGECCMGFGGTYVTDTDILRIAAYVDTEPERFVLEFCEKSGTRYVLRQSDKGTCVFFDRLCTIHPVKPYMCKAWPFIKTLVNNPENWDAMAGSCRGMKPGVPLDRVSCIAGQEQEKLNSGSKITD